MRPMGVTPTLSLSLWQYFGGTSGMPSEGAIFGHTCDEAGTVHEILMSVKIPTAFSGSKVLQRHVNRSGLYPPLEGEVTI